MTLVIRPARVDDSRLLAEMTLVATDGIVEALYEGLIPGKSTAEIVEQRVLASGTTGSYENCWIAEQVGAPLGVLHAYPMDDLENDPPNELVPEERFAVIEPFDHLDPQAAGSFYINLVAVQPEAQGRGIGSALIAQARQEAKRRGFTTLSLIVFEENQGALRLYERLGFTEGARHPSVAHPLIRHGGDLLMLLAPVR